MSRPSSCSESPFVASSRRSKTFPEFDFDFVEPERKVGLASTLVEGPGARFHDLTARQPEALDQGLEEQLAHAISTLGGQHVPILDHSLPWEHPPRIILDVT